LARKFFDESAPSGAEYELQSYERGVGSYELIETDAREQRVFPPVPGNLEGASSVWQ
jgi:hypothetical protein